ncbi:MAG: DUF4386 domain-containing protein [Terricaulis sp.]
MDSLKRTARLTGFLYLLLAFMGPFTLLYVPGRIFVPGDATATVSNILANQNLFLASIVVGIVSELIFVSVVLLLYRLLKGVDQTLAIMMVVLIMIDVPLAFLGSANEVATLAFVRGGEFLAVFDKPQRDALAMLMMTIDRQGVLVSQIFWGLWLLPLGALVFRSGFIPRLIGVWLILNGLAYVALSFIGLILPQYKTIAFDIATPILFGELALTLWLLVFGVRARQAAVAAP